MSPQDLKPRTSSPTSQIVSMVSKKTGISERNEHQQSYQLGGTYIKLENEWRETVKHRSVNAKILKPK